MADASTPLFARDDTLFGICQAIGEDGGFNPDWLRVALAAALLWNPAAVIAGYLAMGLVVLATRLLLPVPRTMAAAPAVLAEPESLPLALAA